MGTGASPVPVDTVVGTTEPNLANPVNVTSATTAWTLGAYGQIVASLGAASRLAGVVLNVSLPAAGTFHFQVEIATGGAGSESVLYRTRITIINRSDAGYVHFVYVPVVPLKSIASGTRVAARCADSTQGQAVGVALIFA